MKLAMLFLAAAFTSGAFAQDRQGSRPFTGYDAEALSDVWPDIREAASFEDIDWRSVGLERAPGSPQAQRFLAEHWDEAREAERFEYIDWDELAEDDRSGRSRGERYARAERDSSPFTREEAAEMSRAWGRIREAARYEDIDWRAAGLSGPPGDREARRLMSQHWPELREAGRFEEIDWQATTGSRTR